MKRQTRGSGVIDKNNKHLNKRTIFRAQKGRISGFDGTGVRQGDVNG
jgi:hypothetical protein